MSSQQRAYASASYAYHEQQQQPQWAQVIPIEIEDDELTFGGKPLSDWYEEDRRRYSSSSDEANRGRTRQKTYAPEHGKHGHKKSHHKKSEKKK